MHFSLGEKQILQTRCIKQHAFLVDPLREKKMVFGSTQFDVFFDVLRRSSVEISISRTSKGAPFRSKRGPFRVLTQSKPATLCCHVGNTAHSCKFGLFQDSDVAGDPEDSKSTSGGIFCIFGSRTLVPISWVCKKQTSVSHIFTEAEIISLDTGLRLDGIPALDLWDLVTEVFHYLPKQSNKTKDSFAQGDLLHRTTSSKRTKNQTKAPTTHDSSDLVHVGSVCLKAKLLCCTCLRIMKP